MTKKPNLFRHHRQRFDHPHTADMMRLDKTTPCPSCGWTMQRGELAFRSKTLTNKYVCSICAMKEMKA